MQQSYSQEYVDLWQRHWWWQVRHEVVLQEFAWIAKQSQRQSLRILDIGCAGGVAFDDFQKWGEVYGIEPDPLLVDSIPHWRHRIEHREFSADYSPSEPFDLVCMLDVLEHIQDDRMAVRHLHSIIRPGGFAILTVPALRWLWSVHDEVNRHFRRYHRQPLKQLLIENGFQVHKLRYLYCWSLGLVLLRTLHRKSVYKVTVPGWPVNGLFKGVTRFENSLCRMTGLPLPCGSSLLAVVQRPWSDSVNPFSASTSPMSDSIQGKDSGKCDNSILDSDI